LKLPFEVVYHSGKYPLIEVYDSREWIPLIIAADLHGGARQFREDIFKRVIAKAVELKAVVLGLGDLFENATKRSVGSGVFEQVLSPRDQVDYLAALLKPAAEQIIELLPGNHEDRSKKDVDITPLSHLCEKLGCREGKFVSRVLFRQHKRNNKGTTTYTLRGVHSKSASKTPGLAQNTIERDWEKWQQYDIIAKAHGHDLFCAGPNLYEKVDRTNKKVVMKERYFIAGGHYLEYDGNYSEQSVLRPKPLGTCIFWLRMNRDHREVSSERFQ